MRAAHIHRLFAQRRVCVASAEEVLGRVRFIWVWLGHLCDGRTRQIVATGASRNAAKTAQKQRLSERQRTGDVSDWRDEWSPKEFD